MKKLLLLLLLGVMPFALLANRDSLVFVSSTDTAQVKGNLDGYDFGQQAGPFQFTFNAYPDTTPVAIVTVEFWYRIKGDTTWTVISTFYNGSYWESPLEDLIAPVGLDTIEFTFYLSKSDSSILNPSPPGQFYVELMGSLLPIKLIDFSGHKDAGITKLAWTTASESNSKEFVLEGSIDALTFKPLGEVNAAGHSLSIKNYNFHYIGNCKYFRLKLVDLDDSFEFSEIIYIENDDSYSFCYWNGFELICNEEIIYVFNTIGQIIQESSLRSGYYFVKTVTGQCHKIVVP
jgi:hypothetical protein